MTNFYVEIIGPYDQTIYGPFPDRQTAVTYTGKIPVIFDTYVVSQTQLDTKIREFGPITIEAP